MALSTKYLFVSTLVLVCLAGLATAQDDTTPETEADVVVVQDLDEDMEVVAPTPETEDVEPSPEMEDDTDEQETAPVVEFEDEDLFDSESVEPTPEEEGTPKSGGEGVTFFALGFVLLQTAGLLIVA